MVEDEVMAPKQFVQLYFGQHAYTDSARLWDMQTDIDRLAQTHTGQMVVLLESEGMPPEYAESILRRFSSGESLLNSYAAAQVEGYIQRPKGRLQGIKNFADRMLGRQNKRLREKTERCIEGIREREPYTAAQLASVDDLRQRFPGRITPRFEVALDRPAYHVLDRDIVEIGFLQAMEGFECAKAIELFKVIFGELVENNRMRDAAIANMIVGLLGDQQITAIFGRFEYTHRTIIDRLQSLGICATAIVDRFPEGTPIATPLATVVVTALEGAEFDDAAIARVALLEWVYRCRECTWRNIVPSRADEYAILDTNSLAEKWTTASDVENVVARAKEVGWDNCIREAIAD